MKKLIINLLLFLFIAGPFCPLAAMGKEAKAGMSGTSKGEVQLEKRENQDGKKVKIWSLGPARAISHSSSASRDTFVMAMHVVPRAILTAGAELGLFALRGAGMTWRLGFHGMFEIYSKEKTTSFAGYPISDIHFYRGVGGYSLAWSLDRLTQRWLGPGSALETTLTVRHESEHYTGSNEGGEGLDYGDFPYAGDFIMLDLAARWRLGNGISWRAFSTSSSFPAAPPTPTARAPTSTSAGAPCGGSTPLCRSSRSTPGAPGGPAGRAIPMPTWCVACSG